MDNSSKVILPQQKSEKAIANDSISRSNMNVDKALTYRLFGHMASAKPNQKDANKSGGGLLSKKLGLFGKSNKVSAATINEDSVQMHLQQLIQAGIKRKIQQQIQAHRNFYQNRKSDSFFNFFRSKPALAPA